MNSGDPHSPAAPSRFAAWRVYLIIGGFAFAILAMMIVRFDMIDALIRPAALSIGKPATAIISSKRVSHGLYLDVNYQYSPDYAPRPQIKVNEAAYAAIALDSHVPIHFIPGCSSCVALDEDYGSARQQATLGLFLIAAVFGFTYLYFLGNRRVRSR